MGLREQALAGAAHRRKTTELSTSAGTIISGSVNLNRTYMLLSIEATVPGRLRIYTDSSSRDTTTEKNRTFETKSTGNSIGLITDVTFSAGIHYFDGGVFGMSLDTGSYNSYYTVETSNSLANTIKLQTFTLEDTIDANPATNYTVANRRLFTISSSGVIGANSRVIGQISSSTLPKTFLLVTASVNVTESRIRLYGVNTSSISVSEVTRAWGTDPESSSALIADINFDSYYNVLSPMVFGLNYSGSNELGYIIDNLVGTTRTISSSIMLYSLED